MNNVKWLLENDIFNEELDPLINEIKKQGMEVKIHNHVPFEGDESWLTLYEPDDCVIFYGSIQFAKHVQRKSRWVPGVWCNFNNYLCSSYYPMMGDNLLNSHYIMVPFGDLKRQKNFLFDTLADDNSLFLRPNRGDKIFNGQLCTIETWDEDLAKIDKYALLDRNEICVAASPVNIVAEWRTIICNGKVIASSQYRPKQIPDTPQEIINFAEICIPKNYEPDRMWTLDVCMTKSGLLKIMEVGSFGCAGLYKSNVNNIVYVAAQEAKREWEEINNLL